MQSVKSFLALGTEDQYKKMNREAFLFRLINFFDGTNEECPYPDGAVGSDGNPIDGYEKVPLTLAQKRRLRNEIIREAKKLANAHNSSHQAKVDVDDYQVLLHAFFKTNYGSQYNRLRHEWGVKGPYFESLDGKTERTNLSSKVSNKRASTFISRVEEWDTGDAVLISPYDPSFVKCDAFTDDTDNLGCIYFKDGIDDDTEFDTIYMAASQDKYKFIPVSHRDKISNSNQFTEYELEGPLTKSGYFGIEHFIKTQKNREDIKAFLSDNVDAIDEVQREFMVEACKYLTSIGMEFDIEARPGKNELVLVTNTGAEVRLLDVKDGPLYLGRIYTNGHTVRLAYSKRGLTQRGSNQLEYNPADYITNEDRLNFLKWYFGGEQVLVTEHKPGSKFINKNLLAGQYEVLSGVPFALTPKPTKKQADAVKELEKALAKAKKEYGDSSDEVRELEAKLSEARKNAKPKVVATSKHLVKFARGSGNDSTFMLSYVNPNNDRYGVAINISITPHASTAYKAAELDFAESISKFTNIPTLSDSEDMDAITAVNTAWINYAEGLDINQIVESDIEVDTTTLDADNNPVRRVKPFVHSENVEYYKHLPVRNTLNTWVESAKENHRRLMNFDDLKTTLEAYQLDNTVVINGTVDESIDELRAKYWKILTGKMSEDEIRDYIDDVDMSGSEDEEDIYDYDESESSVKNYNSGLDFNLLKSGSIEDRWKFIEKHYANYLAVEFGFVPELPKPGEEPDYEGKGFNPEKVARYVNTEKSAGVQKNYDYIRHMLSRLDDYYDESWISSSNYISNEIKNNMIKYNPDKILASFKYSDFNPALSDNAKDFQKTHPVMFEMMQHTFDMLLTSGCAKNYIRLAIDENGIIHYRAHQTTAVYNDASEDFLKKNGLIVEGYLGQIFEPDKYGVIDPKYVVPTDNVFVPGYNAYLVENDPDNPQDLRDRLRLNGWKKQMRMAITREIRHACSYSPVEYDFIPHTTALNRVYKQSYDTRINRNYYLEHLPKNVKSLTPEEKTFMAIIETLKGRCRFPNSYDKGATTEAQSMLEHPHDDKSKRYDFYFSDLCDNENLRVLGEFFDGIFDPDMTGTARTQGIVRYLAQNAIVDDATGKVIGVSFKGNDVPKCALMADELFRNKDFDTWDRREMAASQTLTAWHTPRHIGTAMMTLNGWTFDDGFVVSKKFAEKYQVPVGGQKGLQEETVEYRPLMAQDKLSDFHGNKGVIGLVVDPDLASDVIADNLTKYYLDEHGEYDVRIETLAEQLADVTELDAYAAGEIVSLEVDGMKYNVIFDDNSSDSRAVQVAKAIRQDMICESLNPDDNNNVTFEYDGVSYTMKLDNKSSDSYAIQMAKHVQKQLGVDGLDDIMHLFGENPDLDVVMAPYSGMSRFNGGSIRSLMEEPKDLNVNGKTIEGGMGYTDLIVVDMLADVKSHFYDDEQIREGKGRKASAQLAWALQAKGANVILNEFYGDNGKAFDNLREYAISIGLDFNEYTEPVVGYHPQTARNEKRKLFKLPKSDDVQFQYISSNGGRYFLDATYNFEMTDNLLSALNESGGFMELPFQLDFHTLDFMTGNLKIDDAEDMFKLQPTGQTYVDVNGKEQPTYGLPVLSASLRSGQDFQDGTSKPHDYTKMYVDIYRQAAIYVGYKAELDRIKADKDALVAAKSSISKSDADALAKHEKKIADCDARKKVLDSLIEQCQRDAQTSFDSVVRDIVKNRFDTKYNVVREEIMAKRLNHSATAVWSADVRLKSDEISMSEENAVKLGLIQTTTDENGVKHIVRDEDGNPVPKDKDNFRVLVWRDPILHDGNVRLMNVVIDKRNLKGVCINPLMDASFDGDFDGDSVAIVALSKESAKQAYSLFSFKSNFLNKGLKDTIVNPDTGEEMVGYPLYIQKGLDRAANEVLYDEDGNVRFDKNGKPLPSELKKDIDRITWNINVSEAKIEKWKNSTDPDKDKLIHAKGYVRGKLVDKYGQQAVNELRDQYKKQIDEWMSKVLHGIGTDHVIVKDETTVMKSCQHMVDNKSKGSQEKLTDLTNNLGIVYSLGKDGRVDLDTVNTIVDALGHVCSLDTANGTQRQKDKQIQETAAYKADNTQLGGTAAQRGVSAFRNENMIATLELTYPVTQAILQSKHDPKDAKIKDEIVRFWGADVWNGYALTGDWTNSEGLDSKDFIKKLQSESHQRKKRLVYGTDGKPIPVKIKNVDGQWVDKLDANHKVVYQTEYVKCTREEWIAQMKGMFTALKVDINPDYIDELADVMIREEPAPAVSTVNGAKIMYNKQPVMSKNVNTVMGLDEYMSECGSLLDKMGYFGKAKSMIATAIENSKDIANSKDKHRPTSATALMGDVYSYIIKVKAAEKADNQASVDLAKAKKSSDAIALEEAKEASKTARQALAEAKCGIDNSASFLPVSVANEVYHDYVRKENGTSTNVVEKVKNGTITRYEKAPVPVGRSDCRLTEDDLKNGVAYMGESQTDYEARVISFEKYMEAKKSGKTMDEKITQAEGIVDTPQGGDGEDTPFAKAAGEG